MKYYTEGSPVTIACEASGKPPPDVAWMRNGVLESSGKKTVILKFKNINRTDAGQYTCRANNSVEATSINTTIVVYCKYILTLNFYFCIFTLFMVRLLLLGSVTQNWPICSKVSGNRIPPRILFSSVHIGPKYWLRQLNLGGIIAHIILPRRTWQFFNRVIASGGLCLTRKMAWKPKIHCVWLVHKAGSVWGLWLGLNKKLRIGQNSNFPLKNYMFFFFLIAEISW